MSGDGDWGLGAIAVDLRDLRRNGVEIDAAAVEMRHVVAALQQEARDRRADQAGAAADQDVHGGSRVCNRWTMDDGRMIFIVCLPYLVREQNEDYQVDSQDDLITLSALSYALHIDMQTIRRGWIETGKLQPDVTQQAGNRDVYFFRRDRIGAIRQQFSLDRVPVSSTEWRQEFLDYARSRSLTKSYKPVLLKALLKLVNRNGEVPINDLASEFLAFYVQRQLNNQPVEIGRTPLDNPATVSLEAAKRLIVKYPLDRFLIKGFLEYDANAGIVRFAPQLWSELRMYETLDVQQSADEQLTYYYGRTR